MGVTVAANGLSVVHQGSGGEANATLPDVCLTKVGKPIVPIPYGNNAKSADLAKGTTTITMDGGNPVAIKGSTFSKSTGDAGGDKKGVASGTIEAEAEFISASPTVKFEGKGVCRLSDQMTMNKANTMCLGGAQNPSVSVSAEEEGTYTVDLSCRYPDGEPLKNATFKIFNDKDSEIATGQLNEKGTATVSDLPSGVCKVVYDEDPRSYKVKQIRATNPDQSNMSDDELFDKCSKDCLLFWQKKGISTQRGSWGIFDQSLATDKHFIDMLALEFRAHFKSQVNNDEILQLSVSLATLIEDTTDDVQLVESYLFLLAPIVDPKGEVIQLLYNVHQDEQLDNVLALLRNKGYGDVNVYLKDFDWDLTKKELNNESDLVLDKVTKRLEAIKAHASRSNYSVVAEGLKQNIEKIIQTKKKIPNTFAESIKSLKTKSDTIQSKNAFLNVAKQVKNVSTTQFGSVNDVVNTQNKTPKPLEIKLCYDDQENTPVSNIPYTAEYSSGKVFSGWLNGLGKSLVFGVPQHELPKLQFGDPNAAAQAQSDRTAQLDLLHQEIKKYTKFLALETAKYNAMQPAPNAEILKKIKISVEDDLLEYNEKKADLDNAYWVERWWEIGKSATDGVKDGIVNYIPDFGEIGDVFDNLNIDISLLINALITGNIDELEEALKHIDRSQLYLQEASESMERLLLIISDPEIREYLMTLPMLYADALPADEAAKYGFSIATQKGIDGGIVVSGTALGAAAGGVGAPAMAILLTGAATLRTGGKAIEPVIKALEPLIKGRKNIKNNHKDKPVKDQTNLERGRCNLCGKKLPKTAPKSTKKKNTKANEDGEYCTAPKGYQGKLLKKGDIGYGFTERGTTSNEHYPWRFLPYKSQYVHPWYRLVYDIDVKSNKPTRPKHIKESKEYDQPKDILAAHHLIPVKEMQENDFLFKLLPQLGYDLNQTHNITVLPVLPELGCELGVQIHNSGHPNPYTDKVEALLNKLANKIKKSKACKPQTEQPSIHQQMEKISTKMLELINKNDSGKRPAEGIISQPGKWGDDYLAGNKGCRNKLLESEKTPLSKQCSHRHNGTHHELRNISGIPQPLLNIHKTKIGE